MTLREYLETLAPHLFLTDGARAWNVETLRLHLDAIELGAPPVRLVFDGPVRVLVGNGDPGTNVPSAVETNGVMIPWPLGREMRERLERRTRVRVLTRDGRLYEGILDAQLSESPAFGEWVSTRTDNGYKRSGRVFHVHRVLAHDRDDYMAYAEDGANDWKPHALANRGRLTLLQEHDGTWQGVELMPSPSEPRE